MTGKKDGGFFKMEKVQSILRSCASLVDTNSLFGKKYTVDKIFGTFLQDHAGVPFSSK